MLSQHIASDHVSHSFRIISMILVILHYCVHFSGPDTQCKDTAQCLILVYSSTLLKVLRSPVMIRMSTSFTDSLSWIKTMKIHRAVLDADKNGIYGSRDLIIIVNKLTAYRNQGLDAEKCTLKCFNHFH